MARSFALALLLTLLAAAPAAAADPRRAAQWNLDLIEADGARSVSTGAGATVAVIDSGVQADHPDLAGRIGPSYDVVQRDATPQDGDGHGTHVMGVVGAATGNGVGVESVAPGATLMAVRVLGDDGGGSIDDVARGIDWAREHGADVINLSLGSEVPLLGAGGGDSFDGAIRRAIAAGIVVVAAAGNNGVPVLRAARGARRAPVRRRGRQAPRSGRSSPRSAAGLGWSRRAGRAPRPPAWRSARTSSPPTPARPTASSRAPPRPRRTSRASRRCWSRAGCGGRPRCGGCSPRRRIWVRRVWIRSTGRGWSTRGPRWRGWVADRRGRAARVAPGGAPVRPFVRVKRRQSARRGIRVRVRSARAGLVRVRVSRRGRLVARRVAAGAGGAGFDCRGSADAAGAAGGAAVQGAGEGSAAG